MTIYSYKVGIFTSSQSLWLCTNSVTVAKSMIGLLYTLYGHYVRLKIIIIVHLWYRLTMTVDKLIVLVLRHILNNGYLAPDSESES